jgi:hypothetical protein
MSTNGAVVRLLCPSFDAVGATPTAHVNDLSPRPTELEIGGAVAAADIVVRLAEVTAAAAVAAGCGLVDYEVDGQLSDASRAAVGTHLTKVSMLRLEHFGEIDLASVRAASKRILWEKHGDVLRSQLDTTTIERGFNELIDLVLGITTKVVAAERALAH